MLRSNPRPGGISSISAPNLVRPRLTLTRPSHDIGNSPTNTTNNTTITSAISSTATTTTSTTTITTTSSSITDDNARLLKNTTSTASINVSSNNRHQQRSTNRDPSDNNTSSKHSGVKGDSILQLLFNKVTTALTHTELKPFRSQYRNTCYRQNEPPVLGRNRLSRSFGNISDTHTYDTVFSTNSFVIARGVSNNNIYKSKEDSSSGSNRKFK